MLCWAEYGSTRQLHLAARNYMHNYTARPHQNQRITYELALRNITVLMFSHYINHLESSGALEGHQTLMAHECLMVAVTLGRFHRWQRWVELEDRDKPDWEKVPTISVGDFRHKYSPALVLLGNAQHPTYTHPKLLGWCYDNVLPPRAVDQGPSGLGETTHEGANTKDLQSRVRGGGGSDREHSRSI